MDERSHAEVMQQVLQTLCTEREYLLRTVNYNSDVQIRKGYEQVVQKLWLPEYPNSFVDNIINSSKRFMN